MGACEPDLLTPSEVAAKFAVTPQTVARWADAGKLTPVMTRGGHRRFSAVEVLALLERAGDVGA